MIWHEISGWFDFDDIYMKAVGNAPENAVFVEVGAWLGKSTAFMGGAIKESGKKIDFYAIDTWKGSQGDFWMCQSVKQQGGSVKQLFLDNMKACGVIDAIIPMENTSLEAVDYFRDIPLDLCFIDANHSYPSVKADLDAWYPRVKPGGIFAGHDYTPGDMGVVKAVDEFAEANGLTVHISRSSWILK